MRFVGRSIVSRSALYCALGTALLSVVIFALLFQVQRRVYERRLVKDAEEGIRRISQTFLGYFYAQGNWVYLEDQQRAFNLTENVLYNYIANAQGAIEIGIDGMQSPEVGQLKETWEPPIPAAAVHVDDPFEERIHLEFLADETLARKFPSRVKVGQRVVLISSPISCLTTREICGHLRTGVVFESIAGTLTQLRMALVISGFLLTLLTTAVVFFTTRRFLRPLRRVSANMQHLAQEISAGRRPSKGAVEQLPEEGSENDAEETRQFRESLQEFTTAYQRTFTLESELQVTRSLSDLAAQVAHDIRSPLAALEVASNSLSELPEDRRIMLRGALTRIRDIANNLINDYQPRPQLPSGGSEEAGDLATANVATCLLVSLVEDLLSEKRVQFRGRMGVAIEGRFSDNSYGLFVKASPIAFKRVLSNIINNAVEAIEDKGEVTLTLELDQAMARLRIRDTGKGIHPELLPRLMQKGVSFDKENGVGLGLYFAKVAVEAWGGSVEIQSKVRVGTVVTISLPRVSPPAWFVPSLDLSLPHTVVVVDDDSSIHQVWQGRLEPFVRQGVRVVHFSYPEQLLNWVRARPFPAKENATFLIDYEFIGSPRNGLSVIGELGIESRSILVTSRFEERGVLDGCRERGVRLIPKAQAGFVPVRMAMEVDEPKPKPTAAIPFPPSTEYDVILIDDDPLVRDAWVTRLKKREKRLQVFGSSSEFLEVKDSVPRDMLIFIDSSLGEAVRGEVFAKQLSTDGFNNLFLATGYPAASFPAMGWLKGIVSKDPPEWI